MIIKIYIRIECAHVFFQEQFIDNSFKLCERSEATYKVFNVCFISLFFQVFCYYRLHFLLKPQVLTSLKSETLKDVEPGEKG